MTKIKIMDTQLSNMIAAGEVVERPSGILKELIENSIDANATIIDISVKDGGLSEIIVQDNGVGMSYEDVNLAFKRHATSKIMNTNDLWNIHTLGFRGEALPSIASVSKVTLESNDGNEGSKIEILYGDVTDHSIYGCNKGTMIKISNLFFNTPARLKHLKSFQYEFSLIQSIIAKFALGNPNISFSLKHNDKLVLKTTGRNDLKENIYTILGREVAYQSIEIKENTFDYKITGFLIHPSITRASKQYLYCYINNRMIRSYRISQAIIDAYKEFIPSNRYPICVLHIEMDPSLVDVNVHPSKWEIRLSKEKELLLLIENTIKKAFYQQYETSQIHKVESQQQSFNETFIYPSQIQEETLSYQTKLTISEEKDDVNQDFENEIEEEKPLTPKAKNVFLSMHVIGQLQGKYILCGSEHGLYIIDQHAAAERCTFEKLLNKAKNTTTKQELLLPFVIDIPQNIAVENCIEALASLHIDADILANHQIVVRKVPSWIEEKVKETVIDVIDKYMDNQSIKMEDLRRHFIATSACHHSIRFNRNLTMEEMKNLLVLLQQCEHPYHCPHGRVTFIHLSNYQLEKEFMRIV